MINQYNPFETMTFTYDKCFLCGEPLNEENSSEEHVFPKWLQRKFNLWDKELTLLNGTNIKYRNLKIPCCNECNNEHLSSKLEKRIQRALDGGYSEFIKLDESIIARWLIKLSYGMLFKELSLRKNLRDSGLGNIVTPELLKEFKVMYSFLQTVRFDAEFIGSPWSILIFKISEDDEMAYDAQDSIFCNCYFMRMNDIGIIANLQDGEFLKRDFVESMRQFLDVELHPIQFREICAMFLYKSSLINKRPSFIYCLPNENSKKCTIITQTMNGEVLNEWNKQDYAHILEHYLKPWNFKFDYIYIDDNHIRTFLYNEDGSVKKITRPKKID